MFFGISHRQESRCLNFSPCLARFIGKAGVSNGSGLLLYSTSAALKGGGIRLNKQQQKKQMKTRIPVMNVQGLYEAMTDRRDTILDLANGLGSCYLDKEPARLEAPGGDRSFWRVTDRRGRFAIFTEAVVRLVVLQKGGGFHTQPCRRYSCI
jgi:hypothetical protein